MLPKYSSQVAILLGQYHQRLSISCPPANFVTNLSLICLLSCADDFSVEVKACKSEMQVRSNSGMFDLSIGF
jgi:hypothetical protein